MRTLKRGVLVSLEGIDGAGKSTLINLLSAHLRHNHIDHLVTKEPGGSILGKQLREMLQTNELSICAKAEYLLFAADRAQHMHDIVLPALAECKLVISDRMADSSLAYQGYGRGLDKDMIQTVNAWAMESCTPDLVFFIQIPIAVALERIKKRGSISSFEQQTAFLEKVEQGFTKLFAQKNNVIRIDGTQKTEQSAQEIYDYVKDWLCQRNLW